MNTRGLILAGLLAVAVIAAGAAVALSGRGSAGPPQATSAASGAGSFLTAATMPQGLGGQAVSPFDLADARGGTLSSASLRGRPYALTFLYVHCVDVCPLIGSEIHDALTQLGAKASSMSIVGVSVDPRGDTRAAVRHWLAAHHEPPSFHYLIGSERKLAPVWKAFYVSPQTPGNPHSTHTAIIWLIDRRGRLSALIPAGIPINVNNLAHDFRVLIAQQ